MPKLPRKIEMQVHVGMPPRKMAGTARPTNKRKSWIPFPRSESGTSFAGMTGGSGVIKYCTF